MISHRFTRCLLLALLTCLFQTNAFAEYNVTVVNGNLTFSISDDEKQAAVSACNCALSSSVDIPSTITYKGRKIPVSSILDSAFKGSLLGSVTIPDSVKTIGREAFFNCPNLTTVNIVECDSTLTFSSVGNSCFGNDNNSDNSLQTIYIGRNIDYNTSNYPFGNQPRLVDVSFSSKVTSIPSGMFYNDTALQSITLPDALQSIGSYCFAYCGSLRNVNNYVDNTKLTSVSPYLFLNCKNLTEAIIPKNARTIQDHAFAECKNITTLTVPASVDTIGWNAFASDTRLSTVVFEDSEKTLIVDNFAGDNFSQCPFESIYFGRTVQLVTTAADHCFGNKPTLTKVEFSDKVKFIDEFLLINDSNIETLTIPGSVTQIGRYAFDGCTSLTDMTFEPSSQKLTFFNNQSNGLKNNQVLQSVALYRDIEFTNSTNSPFANSTSLRELTIGGNASKLASSFFAGSNDIDSISLNSNISIIGVAPLFNKITGLKKLHLGPDVTALPDNFMSGCSNLRYVYSEAVEPPAIKESFFSGLELFVKVPDYCSSDYRAVAAWYNSGNNKITSDAEEVLELKAEELASYVQDDKTAETDLVKNTSRLVVTGTMDLKSWEALKSFDQLSYLDLSGADFSDIPNHQFEGLGLYELVLPNTIRRIGNYAFADCSELNANFTFEGEEAIIASYAFKNCTNLHATFEFNAESTSIEDYAFYGCTNFAKSMQINGKFSIGDHAFHNCTKLADISFTNQPEGEDVECTIGDFAFAGTAIAEMTVPEQVSTIGIGVWMGCNQLSSLTISNNESGYIVNKDGSVCKSKTLIQMLGGKVASSYTIPASVESIAEYAFYGLNGLTSLTIPESVKSIDNYAFAYCPNLTKVTLDIKKDRYTTPLNIDATVFAGVFDHATLYLNTADRSKVNSTKATYGNHSVWKRFSSITAPDPQFTVIIDPVPQNGKLSAYPSVADAGKPITLKATPNAGYELVNYVVDGITRTDNKFNMPSHDVKVTANFKPTNATYTISVGAVERGRIIVAESAMNGTNVSVTFVPDEDCELVGWKMNGVNQPNPEASADGTYSSTFEMPNSNVTLSAVFALKAHSITLASFEHGVVNMTVNQEIYSEPTSVEVHKGDSIQLFGSADDGYVFKEWIIEGVDKDAIQFGKLFFAGFVIPAGDVTVTPIFARDAQQVTVEYTEGGTVSVSAEKAYEGETVYVTFRPDKSRDYALSAWYLNDVPMDLAENSFIMTAEAAHVKAVFAKNERHLDLSSISDVFKVKVLVNGAEKSGVDIVAYLGDKIEILVTDVDGNPVNVQTHWQFIEGISSADVICKDNLAEFRMPAADVILSINDLFAITIDPTPENGLVKVAKSAKPGTEVKVQLMPEEDYKTVCWYLDGDEKSVEEPTFIMPTRDVTVSALFERLTRYITLAETIVGGSAEIFVGDEALADVTTISAGDSITLIAHPEAIYDFAGWVIAPEVEGADLAADTCHFFMPSEDIFVTPLFEKKSFGVAVAEGIENGVVEVFVADSAVSAATPTDSVVVRFIPAEDCRLTAWTINDEAQVVHDSISDHPSEAFFFMPFEAVTISATFEKNVYSITTSSDGHGSYAATDYTATLGDTVTVYAWAEDDYDFSYWERSDGEISTDSVYTFSMPAYDVTLVAHFAVRKYEIIVANIAHGSVMVMSADEKEEISQAAAGDTVVLHANPMLGYDFLFDSWRVYGVYADEDVPVTYPLSVTSFVMPALDVVVLASFEDKTGVTSISSGATRVKVTAEGFAFEGLEADDEVTILSVTGQVLFRARTSADTLFVPAVDWEKGTFIVKTNQLLNKVFIH